MDIFLINQNKKLEVMEKTTIKEDLEENELTEKKKRKEKLTC